MKRISKLFAVILAVSMLFSMLSFSAFAADGGYLSGECSLSVYKSGTSVFAYKLLKAEGGEEVSGAIYTVTAADEEDISSYASINSEGLLSLGAEAAGKSFTVAAAAEGYSASIIVQVSAETKEVLIEGTDIICRAPEGTYASNLFKISGMDSSDVVWSISDWKDLNGEACNAPEGIIMLESGELIVPGSAPDAVNTPVIGNDEILDTATFVITAKNNAGEVLAEKTVKYANELNTWTDLPARVFDDMQGQTPGAEPKNKGELGNSNWVDRPISYGRGADTTNVLTVAAEDNGNRYIKAAGRFNQWSAGATLLITPSGDIGKMKNQPVITMESKFKAESEVLENDRFSLWFVCVENGGNSGDKGGMDIRYKKLANGNIGIYSHMSGGEGRYNDFSDGALVAEVGADKWFAARAEIDTVNGVFDLYINDELVMENEPTVLKGVNYIRVGASTDDFALYSGKKLANTYAVSGEETIIPPAPGISSKHFYRADKAYSWLEDEENVKFALKSAKDGVSISENGEVIIDGSMVKKGDFVVLAKSADGEVLGEKTVTIPETLYGWIDFDGDGIKDNLNYIYADAENQTVGKAPNNRPFGGSYDSNTINFYNGKNSSFAPVVNGDENNKYIKSRGQFNGAYSSGSGLLMNIKEDANNIIKNNKTVTLESKFMAEKELFENEVRNYSLWFICDNQTDGNDKGVLDIRYCSLDGDKDQIGIYSNMNEDGTGFKNSYQKGDLLYVVPADEWFDARAEINIENHKFDLYINNVLVLKDEPTAFEKFSNIFSGACIDDVAIYTGRKVCGTVAPEKNLELYADGAKLDKTADGKYNLNGSEKLTAAIAYNDSVLKEHQNKKLIIGIYSSNGMLIRNVSGDILTSKVGISTGAASISADGGSYAKAYIWEADGNKLTPLR